MYKIWRFINTIIIINIIITVVVVVVMEYCGSHLDDGQTEKAALFAVVK